MRTATRGEFSSAAMDFVGAWPGTALLSYPETVGRASHGGKPG